MEQSTGRADREARSAAFNAQLDADEEAYWDWVATLGDLDRQMAADDDLDLAYVLTGAA